MTTDTKRPITHMFARLIEKAGRSRARRELLSQSDRVLADAGFSRAALQSGIAAWPWRAETDDAPAASARAVPSPSRVVPGTPIPVPAIGLKPVGLGEEWHEESQKVA